MSVDFRFTPFGSDIAVLDPVSNTNVMDPCVFIESDKDIRRLMLIHSICHSIISHRPVPYVRENGSINGARFFQIFHMRYPGTGPHEFEHDLFTPDGFFNLRPLKILERGSLLFVSVETEGEVVKVARFPVLEKAMKGGDCSKIADKPILSLCRINLELVPAFGVADESE